MDRAVAFKDLNAFITQDRDTSLAAAAAVDNGAVSGPLAGVGLVIKDNIDTFDMPTTAGTPALKDNQPLADSPCVMAARKAGAINIGKGNLHELARGITSNNAAFGAVRNPWNKTMIPGGSSGGVASAIAAGLAPAGFGTDTGGSCRIPAALCGIVGFRPSLMRWSKSGIVPLSLTRDTAGPLARTVEDCILLDQLCAETPIEIPDLDLAGLRIGVPRNFFYDNLEPEVAQGTEVSLELLRKAGAEIIDVEVKDVAQISGKLRPLGGYESMRELAAYLYFGNSSVTVHDVARLAGGEDIGKVLTNLLDPSKAVSPAAYFEALTVHRPALMAAYNQAFDDADLTAMIVPSTPLRARPIGQEKTVELNGEQVSTFGMFARNTGTTAGAGLPSLSVPSGVAGGLPFGIDIIGRANADGAVLALGAKFEALRGPISYPFH